MNTVTKLVNEDMYLIEVESPKYGTMTINIVCNKSKSDYISNYITARNELEVGAVENALKEKFNEIIKIINAVRRPASKPRAELYSTSVKTRKLVENKDA